MKELGHRPDWGLLEARNNPEVAPQITQLFSEGKGEFLLPPRIQEYLDFSRQYKDKLGPKGDWTKGEIEILENPLDMLTAEQAAVIQLTNQGIADQEARERAQVGIRAKTRWGVSVCAPVKFPGRGALGTYVSEISWGQLETGVVGVAILPQLEDGRFILTKAFRHATRDSVVEIPRGATDPGASVRTTIERELRGEGGVELMENPSDLGLYTPDSGILASRVPLFLAKVRIVGKQIPEESEAIGGLALLTKDQLQEALKEGRYIDREGKTYDFTDGFSQTAFKKAADLGLI